MKKIPLLKKVLRCSAVVAIGLTIPLTAIACTFDVAGVLGSSDTNQDVLNTNKIDADILAINSFFGNKVNEDFVNNHKEDINNETGFINEDKLESLLSDNFGFKQNIVSEVESVRLKFAENTNKDNNNTKQDFDIEIKLKEINTIDSKLKNV